LRLNIIETLSKKRLTIGLIIDWIDYYYDSQLYHGVNEIANDLDLNLICFQDGNINTKEKKEINYNSVYNRANIQNLDGLIISSASISSYVDFDRLNEFCHQFHPLPIVSIGVEIKDIPSIIIDNYGGMKKMMQHLIVDHNFKRFIFIKGPELNKEAMLRHKAFIDSLNQYNLPIDNSTIIEGNFLYESGMNAAKKILELDKKFDAIVSCNDEMALGIIEELKNKNIRIPENFAITGFDDLNFCDYSPVTITTVKQPVYELGRSSCRMIYDILNKRHVDNLTILDTNLIIRESCGCFSYDIKSIVMDCNNKKNTDNAVGLDDDEITKTVLNNINYKKTNLSSIVHDIITSYKRSINEKNNNIFLNELNHNLNVFIWANLENDLEIFQFIISEIRKIFLSHLHDKETIIQNEDLFHQSRVLISNKILKLERNRYNQYKQENEDINILNNDILLDLDLQNQFNSLYDRLPHFGIESFYLSLKSEYPDLLNLIFFYEKDKNKVIDIEGIQFSHDIIVPKEYLPSNRRFSMFFVPLYSSKNLLGYLLYEPKPQKIRICKSLCHIISSALHKSLLFQQTKENINFTNTQKEALNVTLKKLRRSMSGFIQAMILAVEARDPYTAGHQRRVSDLARAIAQELNLDSQVIEGIRMASSIHDIGKLYIPAEILNKPGTLTEIEFNLIKSHPDISYDILLPIDFDYPIAEIIKQHHEKIDGSGYPNKLKDNEIMIEAKILRVADVVEAMASFRPYRPALSIKDALNEISKYRGIFYDPDVVDACLKLFLKKGYNF
jgi:HD-GYP domain-containing protein (c-di-GMP phosphodiesterase class II)/DNA-binding LacI/PurR family transcriptional regulator